MIQLLWNESTKTSTCFIFYNTPETIRQFALTNFDKMQVQRNF